MRVALWYRGRHPSLYRTIASGSSASPANRGQDVRPVEEAGLTPLCVRDRSRRRRFPLRLRTVHPRPYVFINMAMTADGKIDTVERQGARISGTADTVRVDRLRAGADAIMVGGHTLLAEDPRLTVRDPALIAIRVREGRTPQPMKVGVVSRVAGSDSEALRNGGAFLADGGARVLLYTSALTDDGTIEQLGQQGAEVIVTGDERVDLKAMMASLSGLGVARLMVEGGSTLVAALLEAGLVDELQLAIAPLLFGGETAPTPVGGSGWSRDAAIGLDLAETSTSKDGDVVLRYLTTEGAGR